MPVCGGLCIERRERKVGGFVKRKMKNALRLALQTMSPIVDWCVPKDEKLFVFGSSHGDYMFGNARALFYYIDENEVGYRAIYLLKNQSGPEPCSESIYPLKSLKGLVHFFRARYIVMTHGWSDFDLLYVSRRKKVVQAWHGSPLKRMGFAEDNCSEQKKRSLWKHNSNIDLFLVSSSTEQAMISLCFNLDADKIKVVGAPVNDLVTHSRKRIDLSSFVSDEVVYKKAILYAPTYRNDEHIRFFPFENFKQEEFERFLEERDAVLFYRGHKNNVKNINIKPSHRIIELGSDKVEDVNLILNQTDLLITDYSSIFVNYLPLNRSILFLMYDLEAYSKSPGLLYDNIDYWTPGDKPETYSDFVRTLDAEFEDPTRTEKQRKTISALLNPLETKNNCEQAINVIVNS